MSTDSNAHIGWSLHWLHWLVLGLSLLLTFGAWSFSESRAEAQRKERFLKHVNQVISLIHERMVLYENALWASAAHMNAVGGQVSEKEWQEFASHLDIHNRYPGINGIGIILQVLPSEMDAFLKKESLVRPEFKPHPRCEPKEHWPIYYIEPLERNRAALGLDIAFEKNRREAVNKARDTGTSQLTAPIVLVQDDKQTPGFLLYVPYYATNDIPKTREERAQHIIGVTYAPFIMKELMKGTLSSSQRRVWLRISDDGALLYDEITDNESSVSDLNHTYAMEICGRTWLIESQPNMAFVKENGFTQPTIILISGIIIDSLLLVLFILMARSRVSAQAYADMVTADLAKNAKRLKKSNQDLEQFAYVASHDLKSPLQAIVNVVGWLEEDLEEVFKSNDPMSDEVKEGIRGNLGHIKARSARLSRLLESILGYAKFDEENHEPEEVDVNILIKELDDLVNVDGQFEIQYQSLPILWTEFMPLESVFMNLITNAIKHHHRGEGVIKIEAIDRGAYIEFSVTDDGPGIDEQYKDKIFELFSTLQSRDAVEGSGMGLAMIKKVVGYYGGQVWLDVHATGSGATFRFTWPKELHND